jgi:hypothetical protein
MRLDLDDGYTLSGATAPDFTFGNIDYTGLPVVAFTYRPALPEACAQYRLEFRRADSGKAEVAATAKFLAAHVVAWDVVNKGQPTPPTADALAAVPEPIQEQMARIVSKWLPGPSAAADRGNS